MSDDIVKRLRDPSLGSPRWMDTMAEGADHIEAQAARIAELEATLRQFFDAEMDAIVKRVVGAKVTGGEDGHK